MPFKPDIIFDYGAEFDHNRYAETFAVYAGLKERVEEEHAKLQKWGEEVQKRTSITHMGWGFYHEERPYYIQAAARTAQRPPKDGFYPSEYRYAKEYHCDAP